MGLDGLGGGVAVALAASGSASFADGFLYTAFDFADSAVS